MPFDLGDFLATGRMDSAPIKAADPNSNPLAFVMSLIRGSSLDPSAIANAPGSTLDISHSNEDRGRLMPFIQALQQQAATGSGAWESALADATKESQNAASALGQASSPQVGYANALRGIQNAQGAASQRAVGEGNILRAQTQQDAMGRLADVLASQEGGDAAQAAEEAAVRQGVRATGNALVDQQRANIMKTVSGAGQAAVGAMSDGGPVPGEPRVFGDDERNDTVPAMLSPGEIVIPRSIATSPDAARKAMHFVQAVKHGGPKNMAGGGWTPGMPDPTANPSGQLNADVASSLLDPILGAGTGRLLVGNERQAPSYDNGAMLFAAPYEATRQQANANLDRLGDAAMGEGPSVAPQMTRNSVDATMEQAMASGRLPPDALNRVAAATMRGGAEAAAKRAGEQSDAMRRTTDAIANQRARDLAFAQAQQRALWQNTMMNAGLDLSQQAQLRGLLSGAGQAAVGLVGADSGLDEPTYSGHGDSGGSHEPYGTPGGGSHDSGGDTGNTGTADFGDHEEGGASHFAEGGKVKKKGEVKVTVGQPVRTMQGEEMQFHLGPLGPEEWGTYDDARKESANRTRTMGTQYEDSTSVGGYADGGKVERQKARAFLRAMRAA